MEDIKQKQLSIDTIKDKAGKAVHGPEVLRVLKEFYQELYTQINMVTKEDIDSFLTAMSLPKVENQLKLTGIITEQEIASAIKYRKNTRS